jgi:hypothetical protein
MLYSLPLHCPFLTTLHVLLALGIVIVISIARVPPSSARRSGIRPVLVIIIQVDRLIPIESPNGQVVACLVLPAAWGLNICPEIIATVSRETSTPAFNLS